jgi:hypothetical protein
MTTLDTRTATPPTVIEGRFVETAPPVPAPPMPPPKFTAVRASAVLLLVTLPVAFAGLHRQHGGVEVAVAAILTSVAIFLLCVWRQLAIQDED